MAAIDAGGIPKASAAWRRVIAAMGRSYMIFTGAADFTPRGNLLVSRAPCFSDGRSVRVKICGITNIDDALAAAEAGADALGLVFYAKSPRHVDIERAAEIAAAVQPFVTLVGLFVNADAAQVEQVLDRVPLNLLQFHGDEDADYCAQFRRPYIKALRMKQGLDVSAAMAAHPIARGFLLDAYRPGVPGGTGESFDWQRVPQHSGRQIILAGGLTADNVAQAILAARPQAVDVSGGVEASPGRKDPHKIRAFIQAAKG